MFSFLSASHPSFFLFFRCFSSFQRYFHWWVLFFFFNIYPLSIILLYHIVRFSVRCLSVPLCFLFSGSSRFRFSSGFSLLIFLHWCCPSAVFLVLSVSCFFLFPFLILILLYCYIIIILSAFIVRCFSSSSYFCSQVSSFFSAVFLPFMWVGFLQLFFGFSSSPSSFILLSIQVFLPLLLPCQLLPIFSIFSGRGIMIVCQLFLHSSLFSFPRLLFFRFLRSSKLFFCQLFSRFFFYAAFFPFLLFLTSFRFVHCFPIITFLGFLLPSLFRPLSSHFFVDVFISAVPPFSSFFDFLISISCYIPAVSTSLLLWALWALSHFLCVL